MSFYTFFPNLPNPPDDPSDDVDGMQTNSMSMGGPSGILTQNHIGFNANNGGQHTSIQFNQDASYVPSPPVSPPQLFTKSFFSLPQLYFYSGDAAHSANQYYLTGTNYSTYLLGGLIIKGGQFTPTLGNHPYTYSTAFPNGTLSVFTTCSQNSLTIFAQNVTAISASGFSFSTNAQGTVIFYYMAIGY